MCAHCDALDGTDNLLRLLNRLLGKDFDFANGYAYAAEKFKEVSMFGK
jgi:hypothetical protein